MEGRRRPEPGFRRIRERELKRDEILDFVSKTYPSYAWSLHTLCHCLHYFEDNHKVHEL